MAFVPNKTATGFNQSGFRFVKPQSRGDSANNKQGRSKIKSQEKRKDKSGHRIQNNENISMNDLNTQPNQESKSGDEQKKDLINFYVRILEKGLVNTNPIIKYGGKEAFLADINKLRNAEQAINDTLVRLNTVQIPGVASLGPLNALNNSGFDSSQLSPVADSIHGGTLNEIGKIGLDHLKGGYSPKNHNEDLSTKMIDYMDEGALKSKSGLAKQYEDTIQIQKLQSRLGELEKTPVSVIPHKHQPEIESLDNSILVEQTGGHLTPPLKGGPHAQKANNDGLMAKQSIISPFEMEKLTASQEVVPEGMKNLLIEKSIGEEQASINTQQRVNVLNKYKQTPQPSIQTQNSMHVHQSMGMVVMDGPTSTLEQQIMLQHQQHHEGGGNQSVFVMLNEQQQQPQQAPPSPEKQNLSNATLEPQFEFEMPVIHAQVNLHRKRQRNQEEKLRASLSKQFKGTESLEKKALAILLNEGGNKEVALSKNKELDSLWTPPDMSSFVNPHSLDLYEIAKLQQPMHNGNRSIKQYSINYHGGQSVHEQSQQHNAAQRSRSPKKELQGLGGHNQSLSQGSIEVTGNTPKKQHYARQFEASFHQKNNDNTNKVQVSASLSQRLLASQHGHMNLQNHTTVIPAVHHLHQKQESQLPNILLSPVNMSYAASMMSFNNPMQPNAAVHCKMESWQPNVVNVGALSKFEEPQNSQIKGQFPAREAGVNEQKFFRKDGYQPRSVSSNRGKRAQTASQAQRIKHKNTSLQKSDAKLNGASGNFLTDDRRAFSLNSSGQNWMASNKGFDMKNVLDPVDEEDGQGAQIQGGTVVLQATLMVGNNKHHYVYPLIDGGGVAKVDSPNSGNPSSKQSQRMKQSRRNSQDMQPLSGKAKVQQMSEKTFGKKDPSEATLVRGGTLTSGNYTGVGPSALQEQYQDQHYLKLSPKKGMQLLGFRDDIEGQTATAPGTGRDGLDFNNGNVNFTACLQRRYDNQSFVVLNGAQQHNLQDTPGRMLQGRSRDQLIKISRADRSNSGSLSKRRTSKPTPFEQQQNLNRRNVLAKSKNKVIDISSENNKTVEEPKTAPQLREAPTAENTVIRNAEEIVQKDNSPKQTTVQNHHPQQQLSKRAMSAHRPQNIIFKSGDTVTTGEMSTGVGVLGHKMHYGLDRVFSAQPPSSTNNVKGSEFRIRTQKASVFSNKSGLAEDIGLMVDPDLENNQLAMSKNNKNSTGGYLSSQNTRLAQTGISFFSQNDHNAVKVNVKSTKRSDQARRNKIEFKILQMNLAQPAPGQEKTNIMTCELDLTQHLFNRFKINSKDHQQRPLNQQSGPNITKKNLLSKTLSLTTPTGQMMLQNKIAPHAVAPVKQQQWQEINQMKVGLQQTKAREPISSEGNLQVVIPTLAGQPSIMETGTHRIQTMRAAQNQVVGFVNPPPSSFGAAITQNHPPGSMRNKQRTIGTDKQSFGQIPQNEGNMSQRNENSRQNNLKAKGQPSAFTASSGLAQLLQNSSQQQIGGNKIAEAHFQKALQPQQTVSKEISDSTGKNLMTTPNFDNLIGPMAVKNFILPQSNQQKMRMLTQRVNGTSQSFGGCGDQQNMDIVRELVTEGEQQNMIQSRAYHQITKKNMSLPMQPLSIPESLMQVQKTFQGPRGTRVIGGVHIDTQPPIDGPPRTAGSMISSSSHQKRSSILFKHQGQLVADMVFERTQPVRKSLPTGMVSNNYIIVESTPSEHQSMTVNTN